MYDKLYSNILSALDVGQDHLFHAGFDDIVFMDEVGVKFSDAADADLFMSWAAEAHDLEHFNHSDEHLVLNTSDFVYGTGFPMKAEFDLRLDFLRDPASSRPWRIEVMVPSGSSPLHDPVPTATVIHTAFKVRWDKFGEACEKLMGLTSTRLLGSCESAYGMFAYFGDHLGAVPYLKPRAPRLVPAGHDEASA